jgi:16S rRNA processing protein RimM
VGRPHGLRGELRCEIVTEFPERFASTRRVWLGSPPGPYEVRRARAEGRIVLLALRGVETPEQADALRGLDVLIPREEAVPLPPGRFYWHQVIGLAVREEDGRELGPVVDILETGANHVYVVRAPTGELLLPAIPDVVLAIEPERGSMTVRLLPGLEPGTATP